MWFAHVIMNSMSNTDSTRKNPKLDFCKTAHRGLKGSLRRRVFQFRIIKLTYILFNVLSGSLILTPQLALAVKMMTFIKRIYHALNGVCDWLVTVSGDDY